jgi:hypothetical protein
MRFGRFHKAPLPGLVKWRSAGLALLLAGGAAVFATQSLAQQAPAVPLPMPLTTPKPPSAATTNIPVIGAEPAPPQGYEPVAPGVIPQANMPASPVGVAAPVPQRQLVRAETESRPIVIELFTAQGCANCPAADSYIGQLARRKDVLPLSFHVDYWDYIGWKDQFADPVFVGRQRAYAMTLGQHMVYTPQVVVAGATDAQGANRAIIQQRIREAKARQHMYPIEVLRDPQTGQVLLELPEAQLPVPATIWLVTYQYKDKAAIDRGENVGRDSESFNTVRSLQKVAVWNGRRATLPLQLDAKAKAAKPEGCAIIANLADYGPVVAAVAFDFGDAW